MADAKFGKFRPNSGGIAAVFKGGGMMAALEALAAPIGEAAQAEAEEFARRELHIDPEDVEVRPMYEHGAKALRGTAVGYVNARGLGAVNEAVNHSVSRRNH